MPSNAAATAVIETKRYFVSLKGEQNEKVVKASDSNQTRWKETITIEEPENFDFVFKPEGLKRKEQEEGRTMAAARYQS